MTLSENDYTDYLRLNKMIKHDQPVKMVFQGHPLPIYAYKKMIFKNAFQLGEIKHYPLKQA